MIHLLTCVNTNMQKTQHHVPLPLHNSLHFALMHLSTSTLSLSITSSLFHYTLETHLSVSQIISIVERLFFFLRTAFHDSYGVSQPTGFLFWVLFSRCTACYCHNVPSVTRADYECMEKHVGNICMRLDSPTSWMSACQRAFGYSDGILPIFYVEFLINNL